MVEPMRAARKTVIWSLLSQVLWLPIGLALGLTLGWWLAVAPVAVTLSALVVLLVFMLAWQRADTRRESLLTTGTRVPAVLVSSRATRNRVRHRRIMAHTFEARLADGVVRVEEQAFVTLPVGARATIAYDAADSSKAVLVEDLDEVASAGQPDWQELKQRQIDRTFRKSS
jgi:hypothetical protein